MPTRTQRSPRTRAAADAGLQAHLAVLQTAFDAAPFAVWVRDRSGHTILQNAELVRMCGDQLGKRPEDSGATPADVAAWRAANRRAFAGHVVRGEVEYRIGGEKRRFDNIVTPLRLGRRVVAIMGFLVDITERRRTEDALRASEARYRLMVEAVPTMAWHCAANGDLIEANRRWYDYTGQTPDEACGNGWMQALHPDDRTRVARTVKDDVSGGIIYETEYRLRRASDGRYRWHLARALPVRDEAGRIRGWFGAGVDIHTQKSAEEVLERRVAERTAALEASEAALRQSMATLDAFFESSPAILNIDDEAFRYVKTDSVTPQYFGLDPHSIVGKSLADLAPEFLAAYGAMLRRVVKTGKPALNREVEAVVPNRPGERTVWRASYFRVPLANGRHGIGIVGVDITDMRKAERALRENQERLQLALDGGGMGTWDLDLGTHRVIWDARQFELHGLPERTGPMDVSVAWDRIHPEDRAQARQDFERQMARGNKLRNEFRVVLPDGSTRWLAGSARVLRDASGAPVRVIGVNYDITERRRADDARRELERQVLVAAELERQSIGRDLHDGLGQVLAGLAFSAGTLAARLAQKRAPEAGDARLIAGHLGAAVAQTRGLAAALQPVAADPGGLADALGELCSTAGTMFRVDCRLRLSAAAEVKDSVVANHLFRIAQESIHNAVRHGKARRIRVALRVTGRTLVLTVGDNGRGLPHGGPPKEGIGLPTMRYRAAAMGGTVTIAPGPRGGTVVTCTVPRPAGRSRTRAACTPQDGA